MIKKLSVSFFIGIFVLTLFTSLSFVYFVKIDTAYAKCNSHRDCGPPAYPADSFVCCPNGGGNCVPPNACATQTRSQGESQQSTNTAPANYTLIGNIFGDDNKTYSSSGGFLNYLGDFYNILFLIGGSLAVVMITVGGFLIMFGGFQGDISKNSKGRTMITDAIIGLILLLVSYILLEQINPALLNFVF